MLLETPPASIPFPSAHAPSAPCPWGSGKVDRRRAAELIGRKPTALRDWHHYKRAWAPNIPPPPVAGYIGNAAVYDTGELWAWWTRYSTTTPPPSPRRARQPRRCTAFVATTDAAAVRDAARRGARWTVAIIETAGSKPTGVWLIPTDGYAVPEEPPEGDGPPRVRLRLPNRA
jgi:hypothetical protein